MSNFGPITRDMGYLLPPSVDDWLPEQHLARFVVEVIEGLDLSAMSKGYRGSGSASYHPVMLVSLLVYGYATGVSSSPSWNVRRSTAWRSGSSRRTSTPTHDRHLSYDGYPMGGRLPLRPTECGEVTWCRSGLGRS